MANRGFRKTVSNALHRVPPLQRVTATAFHQTHRGHRMAAVGRAVRYEVMTTGFGKPTVVPLGERSRIIAYQGETNTPNAVVSNPPNPTEMGVWRRELHPGDLFIDIGANVGVYTIWAIECGAEVIAVEPVRGDRVREHLALNGYQAEVVEKALAGAPGTVRMTTDLDSLNHITQDTGAPGVDVAATTLDLLLGDRVAAGVKIDVEGAEDQVLAGAERALREQRIKLLQLEWMVGDEMGIDDRNGLRTVLEAAGYGLFLPDASGALRPVTSVPASVVNVFAKPTDYDRVARPA